MKEPVWVMPEAVRLAHQEQLAEHGGSEGTRDAGLLESALHRAQNLFAYSNPAPTLFQMAAAYGYGIARNHPFVDGNKRTALVVTMGFLRLNQWKIEANQVDRFQIFYSVAAGSTSEANLAKWLESHAVRVEK